MKWDAIILEKTSELGRHLIGGSGRLDFSEPAPILERTDNREVSEMILNLTQAEARKRGIGKSTLHYMRQRAISDHSVRTYRKVCQRLPLF